MIRVLICDDQPVVGEGLRLILSTAADITVVAVAHNGVEALVKIPETKPDLILMDLKMPGMNGVQATQIIHAQYPAIKVLALTTYAVDEWVSAAIRSGASGYLLKDIPRERLVAAIQETMAGRSVGPPEVKSL